MKNLGIVGGGLLGRVAAFVLVNEGYNITIFEKSSLNPPVGNRRSAAFSSAGMLSPLSERESGGEEVFNLGTRSMVLWPLLDNLVRDTIGTGLGLKIQGNIFVSQHQDLPFSERLFERLDFKKNPASVDLIQNIEPCLDSKLKCWLVENEGQIDPHVAMENLYQASINNNSNTKINWCFDSEVNKIEGSTIFVNEKKNEFDWIFDFRGTGANELNIRGVRGEIFVLSPPKNFVLNHPIRLIHPRVRIYVVPKINGEVIVGATEIEVEDLSPVSVNSTLELLNAAQIILPELNEARVKYSDVNLRPATTDNLPIYFSNSKITSVNGLFRHGWLLAPALLESVFLDIGINTALSVNKEKIN
jgi:glycine oxidase